MKTRAVRVLVGLLSTSILPVLVIISIIVWIIRGEGFIEKLFNYILIDKD